MKPVYIKIHFWKYCGMFFLAWGLLIALLFLMQHGDFFMSGRFKYMGMILIYFLVPMAIIMVIMPALWLLWRILYIRRPLLTITKNGFIDDSSFVACSFISWKEIKNISLDKPLPPIGPLDNKYEESINIMVAVKNLKTHYKLFLS